VNSAQTLLYCGILFCCFLFVTTPAQANIKLPSILSDNMVLQQNRTLYFWGLSDPEEIVVVTIGEHRYGCTADAKGAWWVKIPPQNTKVPFDIKFKGKNAITVHNVITGDVWLCAGQSNMYAPLKEVEHTPDDIEGANLPDIRLFKEEPNCAGDPEFDGGGKWVTCTPETVQDFSAIGYFFGREINDKTKNVLGLIQATRPGSCIETWLSKESLLKTPYKGLIGENDENFKQYEALMAQTHEAEASGNEAELQQLQKQARVFKKKVNTATCAYNALIAPLAPYQLKGVLWYQGENDIGFTLKYRQLLTQLIQDWRDEFRSSTLPFYYVQLPPIGVKKDRPEDSYYAELREAQSQIQKSPYAYMVVTVDTGLGDEIPMHPREKKTIAHRLAYLVLATQYNEPLKCFGPSFDAADVEDNAIRVHIKRAEPELVAKGGTPQGFEIAGEDRLFYPAEAKIDGDSIVVFNKKVKKPVAVRYAWADNPRGNIFNSDDVPLIPFRSDTWPYRKPEDLPVAKTASAAPSSQSKTKPKEAGAWGSFGGSSSINDKPSTQPAAAAPTSASHPPGKNGQPFAWPVAK
jgi:sialate O-acetylesterase